MSPPRYATCLGSACAPTAESSFLGGGPTRPEVAAWFRHDKPLPPAIATPVETPPPPPPTQLPKPKPVQHEAARPEKPEKAEKPDRVAEVDPNSLIGLDPPTVEKMLGTPTKISKSDISLVWTFSAQN